MICANLYFIVFVRNKCCLFVFLSRKKIIWVPPFKSDKKMYVLKLFRIMKKRFPRNLFDFKLPQKKFWASKVENFCALKNFERKDTQY